VLCSFLPLWFSVAPVVKRCRQFLHTAETPQQIGNTNYQRNLMGLTGVPRMGLVWVTKLFSSVPMKKPLAR
jgi:hypothetical protein